MALLVATTLGSEVAAEPVHAEVKAPGELKGDSFRLIVQSYDAGTAALRAGRAKPVGSMQRVVSAEELKNGIRVDFVELRDGERGEADKRPLVVAWLEPVRAAGYDLDAREARPPAGSLCGYAHRSATDVKIRLDRRAT
jgi:hypothetical protein